MLSRSTSLTRRQALKLATGGAATLAGFPAVARGRFALFAASEEEYSARAIDVVGRTLVIDMLSPPLLDFRKFDRWMQDPDLFTEEDWRRYRDSGIRVFHIAIGTGGNEAYEQTHRFLALWNGFLANHDELLLRIDSASDLERLQDSTKVGILLGVQNSDHFRTLEDVDYFHSLGQRVSQLTYNSRNRIGNGSTERVDGGISNFGVAVVGRMNEIGMAVDVSHSGDRTTLDACEISTQPVLFTHSNCRALASGHPRTKTDEAIRKMADTGGVMGITGVRMFVRGEEPTTIEHVLDHYDHVARLVGAEHLGIGSDMDLDGYDDMPPDLNAQLRAGYTGAYAFRERIDIEGLDHPKRVFDLTEGLIRRGYSDPEIEGILGRNFQRVLAEIWSVEPAVVALSAAELERLAGDYSTDDASMQVTIRRTPDGLSITLPQEGTLALTPLSATRFRIHGAPPGYSLEFDVEGDRVRGASLQYPGKAFLLRRDDSR